MVVYSPKSAELAHLGGDCQSVYNMGADAIRPRTTQVSAARWSAHPVVRRDRQRYNQTCRDAPVPTSSLERVLLVDGRCVCINNGIGNLFGDYTVWFVAAALAGRRLFIDWQDTATNATVFRAPHRAHPPSPPARPSAHRNGAPPAHSLPQETTRPSVSRRRVARAAAACISASTCPSGSRRSRDTRGGERLTLALSLTWPCGQP